MVRIRLSPPRTTSLTGLYLLTLDRGEFRRIFRDFMARVSKPPSGRRRFLPHNELRRAVRLVFAWEVVRRSRGQMQNSRRESQTGNRDGQAPRLRDRYKSVQARLSSSESEDSSLLVPIERQTRQMFLPSLIARYGGGKVTAAVPSRAARPATRMITIAATQHTLGPKAKRK
jgi:hypothetical protein